MKTEKNTEWSRSVLGRFYRIRFSAVRSLYIHFNKQCYSIITSSLYYPHLPIIKYLFKSYGLDTFFKFFFNKSLASLSSPLTFSYIPYYLVVCNVKYSKTCLKRNAIVPVFFSVFTGFRFTKGCVFIKQSTKNMIA